jgi:hypothetical protein
MAASTRPELSRRGFLAVTAAGLVALTAGCTSDPAEDAEPVTAAQVDSLAEQVRVQTALVGAYAAAAAADPALGTETTEPAAQAGRQLERLRAASPGSASGSASGSAPGSASAGASSSAPVPTVGGDPRQWLRGLVLDAASSHAGACAEQSGARAALLGSIAAGLRGQAAVLS